MYDWRKPIVSAARAVFLLPSLRSFSTLLFLCKKAQKMAAGVSPLSSTKALTQEMKRLREQPVEGFRVGLVDDNNIYEWEVAIFGPPDTLYQGGYFKVSFLLCPSTLCRRGSSLIACALRSCDRAGPNVFPEGLSLFATTVPLLVKILASERI